MTSREGGWTHGGVARLGLLIAAAAVVCSGQSVFSDAAQYAAKAETVVGQVTVLHDSQPWAVSVGDSVQVQQIILTGPEGYAVFRVSDGSTFEVYPNSRVQFRKSYPSWRDLIDVLVGRVRVHIEHFGNVPNPNKVYTPTAVISVRGTTFDIQVNEDDDTTIIEVEEGLVEVRHLLLPSDNPTLLQQGESVRVYKNAPLASNTIDKGTIYRHIFKAVLDALATGATRSPGGSTGGVGGGGPRVGDSDKTAPPPTVPPSLPPLPPLNFAPDQAAAQVCRSPKHHSAIARLFIWGKHKDECLTRQGQ